jgi:hypothetical protein
MLYGVRSRPCDQVVSDGHRLGVYVPYGQHWYAYSMRRFKENPQMVCYVLRAIFLRRLIPSKKQWAKGFLSSPYLILAVLVVSFPQSNVRVEGSLF